VNSLPKTATLRRHGCDLNPGPSAPESSTLTTRLQSHWCHWKELNVSDKLSVCGSEFLVVWRMCRSPVKCGSVIRLTHLNTNRNLHSHHFQSPLSHNLEVSAFGDTGEGDEGMTM